MAYVLHIIVMISIWMFVTLGYNLVLGRGKILFFGQEALSLLAVYGIFLPVHDVGGYTASIAAGILLTLLLAVFFAWLALRLESDAFAILSIAMHLALLAVILNWSDLTRGALGIPRIPRFPFLESQGMFAFVIVTSAVLWYFFIQRLDASRLGRELKALAENKNHAEALGIHRFSVYVKAFLIAGIGSILSSFFYPQYIGLLHPSDYTFQTIIPMLLASIAGGSGSVRGCAIAVIGITCLTEGLRFVPLPMGSIGALRVLLFGVIFIVAIYLRRESIFPKPRTV